MLNGSVASAFNGMKQEPWWAEVGITAGRHSGRPVGRLSTWAATAHGGRNADQHVGEIQTTLTQFASATLTDNIRHTTRHLSSSSATLLANVDSDVQTRDARYRQMSSVENRDAGIPRCPVELWICKQFVNGWILNGSSHTAAWSMSVISDSHRAGL